MRVAASARRERSARRGDGPHVRARPRRSRCGAIVNNRAFAATPSKVAGPPRRWRAHGRAVVRPVAVLPRVRCRRAAGFNWLKIHVPTEFDPCSARSTSSASTPAQGTGLGPLAIAGLAAVHDRGPDSAAMRLRRGRQRQTRCASTGRSGSKCIAPTGRTSARSRPHDHADYGPSRHAGDGAPTHSSLESWANPLSRAPVARRLVDSSASRSTTSPRLPKALRARLDEELPFARPRHDAIGRRRQDHEVAVACADGAQVETVLMRTPSAPPCACRRKPGARWVARSAPPARPASNATSTPARSCEQVVRAAARVAAARHQRRVHGHGRTARQRRPGARRRCTRLHDDFGISARHLTVSTVGVVPGHAPPRRVPAPRDARGLAARTERRAAHDSSFR